MGWGSVLKCPLWEDQDKQRGLTINQQNWPLRDAVRTSLIPVNPSTPHSDRWVHVKTPDRYVKTLQTAACRGPSSAQESRRIEPLQSKAPSPLASNLSGQNGSDPRTAPCSREQLRALRWYLCRISIWIFGACEQSRMVWHILHNFCSCVYQNFSAPASDFSTIRQKASFIPSDRSRWDFKRLAFRLS